MSDNDEPNSDNESVYSSESASSIGSVDSVPAVFVNKEEKRSGNDMKAELQKTWLQSVYSVYYMISFKSCHNSFLQELFEKDPSKWKNEKEMKESMTEFVEKCDVIAVKLSQNLANRKDWIPNEKYLELLKEYYKQVFHFE